MLSNGSSNKKFLITKDSFKTKAKVISKQIAVIKSSSENKEVMKSENKEDEIQIKERSPYMYNRNKFSSNAVTFNHPNQINTKICKGEEKIKFSLNENKNIFNQKQKIPDGKELIQNDKSVCNKLIDTEIQNKLAEQEKVLKDKNSKIVELEEQNLELRLENHKVKEKYHKLKTRVRQRINQENEYDGDLIMPINEYPQMSQLQRITDMINGMREVMFAQQEDEDLINQIYPDPDNMTYEQLLELQEQIGFVNKGLCQDEINKIPIITFSKNNTSRKNFSETCTVCQSDFADGEKLKQLKCHHCYHKSCVDEWLKDNNACPICKEDIKY